ncbi:protein phosphatase 1 regulatory subunit 3D-like [Astyanax mexicanus]|uniref:Protein phosphatase 1 regulatory subunit 3D-like n=1 Tax=Astyanax mexicanus TaxID=7994 RepID=A0A8T2KKL0_ASTMX|nr:protein phosphatase 1 regulatory subunit 3D-like [Astyanax mexicanus]
MSTSYNLPPVGQADSALQSLNAFSEGSRPARTIRLRHIFDPQPVPQRKPVAIRPPSNLPPPKEWVTSQSLSCESEPRAIMRQRSRSVSSSCDQKARRGSQVRFVDSLGLELERVKFFKASEDPTVPVHVICRLLASSELAFGKHLELTLPYFQPSFPENMASQPDFLQRLCRQHVCLEQVHCSELGIIGTVQVLNLAFEKDVTVRYSFTDWKSSAESKACWVSTLHRNGDEPESDIFRFRLPVPPFILKPGATLQFAICFQSQGVEYWDNNDGHNYKLACHTYKLTVPKECEDSMVHFT